MQTVHLGNKTHVPEKVILNVAVYHYMPQLLIRMISSMHVQRAEQYGCAGAGSRGLVEETRGEWTIPREIIWN